MTNSWPIEEVKALGHDDLWAMIVVRWTVLVCFVCRWVLVRALFYLLTAEPLARKVQRNKQENERNKIPKGICVKCITDRQGMCRKQHLTLGAVILNPRSTPRNGASASQVRWAEKEDASRCISFDCLCIIFGDLSSAPTLFAGTLRSVFGAASSRTPKR